MNTFICQKTGREVKTQHKYKKSKKKETQQLENQQTQLSLNCSCNKLTATCWGLHT